VTQEVEFHLLSGEVCDWTDFLEEFRETFCQEPLVALELNVDE
jgi:hypothetical protein